MVLVRGVRDRGGVADGGPRSQATSKVRVLPWLGSSGVDPDGLVSLVDSQ